MLLTLIASSPTDLDVTAEFSRGLSTLLTQNRDMVLLFHEYTALAVRDPALAERYAERTATFRTEVARAIEGRFEALGVPLSMPAENLATVRVRTTWKRGPAAASPGSFLISYTEFTPHTMRDVPAIYVAAERLRGACAALEGAVGVTTYWQLFRRRGGSVSVWEDEAALRRFVSLPFHVEIMRRYRPRGTVRAIDWHAGSFDLRAAFDEGQRALEGRVTGRSFRAG